MGALPTLLAVAGVALALAFCLVWLSRRRRAGARSDLAAFLRRCEAEGTAPEIAAQVFHALQGWMANARGDFAVRADDPLESVYGIGADELAETLGLLLRRCGRRAKAERPPTLRTPAELARYVASCPRDPGSRAA